MLKALVGPFGYIVAVLILLIRTSGAESAGPLADSKSDKPLEIRLAIPGVCRAGDVNAVAQDMMFSDKQKEAKILLSLASLDGSEEYVTEILQELKSREFMEDPLKVLADLVHAERLVKLDIKRPNQEKVFALAVCKDTSGGNSCQRKSESKYRDIMEILRAYTDPKPGIVSDDSVYFYQLLVVGPNGVELAQKPLYSDNGFKEFAKKNMLDQKTQGIQLGRLRKIYSVPIIADEDRLVIKLPLHDAKRCG